MDGLLEKFINTLQPANLVALAIMLGFFYSRLDSKIDKLGERIDGVERSVHDIDKRLCRIEGSLASHSYCALTQSRNDQDRRAE